MHEPHSKPIIALIAWSLLLAFARPCVGIAAEEVADSVSLAGTWAFQLDLKEEGRKARWFKDSLEDSIDLPTTTDEAKKGKQNNKADTKHLSRVYPYAGPAWYQREVEIPASWLDKRITLLLERTKTTTVWVDETEIGSQNTLVASQVSDLTSALTPGRHRITLCVDNKKTPPVGDPHQISDQTQTNWNGVIGRIELRATDPVWIDDVRINPDVPGRKARVRLAFGGKPARGFLTLSARSWNTDQSHVVAEVRVPVQVEADNTFETDLVIGEGAQLWDEFNPALYRLAVSFSGELDGKPVADRREVDFGLRNFAARGTQFAINGKTVFLRGKHDACVFPLTGYPPMDVDGWVRVLKIAKSYGINHYRFHTWCPPEAAFAAADIVGIYFQPELPIWGAIGAASRVDDKDVEQRRDSTDLDARTRFLTEEGKRLFRQFGNHASFVMFALGNEMSGSREVMGKMVAELRAYDQGRRLFAQGSNNFLNAPQLAKGDDYWTTTMTGGHYKSGVFEPDSFDKVIRGSSAVHTMGHINNQLVGTTFDFRKGLAGIAVPVIGHETGQFEVYPDFKQLGKYTGVVRPRNIERFRDRLEKNGMLSQADDFFRASGALAVICYREEIEAALRTPGFGGFQLLDLQDFPGQGTALVGILDAFMDSKGLITPETWREFCSETVPLVRYNSHTWTNSQTFQADAEVAHYGPAPLSQITPRWTLADAAGKTVAEGKLPTTDIPQGKLVPLGKISINLRGIAAPQKLTLILELPGTGHRNHYPLWIYPAKTAPATPRGVMVASALDGAARAELARGGKVFLMPEPSTLLKSIDGAFTTDFWCYPMFKHYKPPGSMGILCDPKHPALAGFPTEFHSNWQWWCLTKNARPMNLNSLPRDLRPIVQVIDNYDRNDKLALVWEAKVGPGKLLVCTSDLLGQKDAPEVRQFTHSLLNYADSQAFNPGIAVELKTLDELIGAKTDK